jgi:hypothetical protein
MTTSKSGKWQWTWTFYPQYAELLIDKVDQKQAYWFLYEGIPGGKYRPQYQYWGTDRGGPNRSIPDYYFGNAEFGNWQWIYFGNESVNRVFYILHKNNDDLTDTFSYLGSTEEGVISPDGMVVFGFGRGDDAQPLLTRAGQTFVLGFWEGMVQNTDTHQRFAAKMEELISD